MRTALTHSSYINEHGLERQNCNERLEFLGDAVLELISSEFLFHRDAMIPEGEMTKQRASLVCEPALADDAKKIGLGDYLIMGRGEELNGGRCRDSIVSDAVEAVIGAIFLDGGIDPAREFIHQFILSDTENKLHYLDAKTVLQEIAQEDFGESPVYSITGENGPDHDKIFTAEVLIDGHVCGEGSGRTKKNAEQAAAFQALNTIKGNQK